MAKPAASRAAACETYIIPVLFYFYSLHFTNVFILFYSIRYLINKFYSNSFAEINYKCKVAQAQGSISTGLRAK
jgi:hypothetical protein